MPYHPPGRLRKKLALVGSPVGSLEGVRLPDLYPGYSAFSRWRESGFLARQRKRMSCGCLQPSEVSQRRVSPKRLEKPLKLMEKKLKKKGGGDFYLQFTTETPGCMARGARLRPPTFLGRRQRNAPPGVPPAQAWRALTALRLWRTEAE